MSTAKKPVRLYVCFHDSIPRSTQRIVPRNYLKSCVMELERVTSREFVIDYRRSVPGLTDIDYRGPASSVINEWTKRVRDYTQANNLSRTKTDRYLLVTPERLDETTLGITYIGHYALVASLETYQVIAHELGHSFGATHEDAELQYNAFGGVCETYVYSERNQARANCYTYSLKNRENIRAFLRDVP